MNDSRHTHLKGNLGKLPVSALGIWGSGCSFLQQWALDLSKWIGGQASICYVDEKHKSEKPIDKDFPFRFEGGPESPVLFSNHALLSSGISSYWASLHELVLFNGHHLKGEHYWLVWDGKKEFPHRDELIEKTVLVCIPTKEWNRVEEIRSKNPKLAQCPILPVEKVPMIIDWIRKWMDRHLAPVQGLVLAGGKSERMGRDKATLDFHGVPQVNFLSDLLGKFLKQTYVSCTAERVPEFSSLGLTTLSDTFLGLGPLGGILSAFQQNPLSAWMVVACDMPNFNEQAIKFLLDNRKSSAPATALKSRYGKGPEPLACIWEPSAYPILLQRLSQGFTCPVKALSAMPCHVVEVPDDSWVANVNSPEDVKKITSKTL